MLSPRICGCGSDAWVCPQRLVRRLIIFDPHRLRAGLGMSARMSAGGIRAERWASTIQFESHRVELAGIYEMEHDAVSSSTTISRRH